MSQNEDKFEEEFSNWAKTVLGLQNARDDSIELIKFTMKSFADKLIQKHGSNDGEHFKDLLIKVAVNGDVKKIHKDKKDPTSVRWLLDNNNCRTCDEIFEELQDNFTGRRCICKDWISNSEKKQIISSSYWWVLAKLYTINSDVRDAEGTKDVEPLAVFNLLKRCGLFVDNIRIHADNLVILRNKLMHSPSNRLTDIEMRESFNLIKDFIKLVLDRPDEAINDLETIKTSTVVLFDENGEYGEVAKKALQEQEKSLNADFKSPEGIRVAIKSIAASNIELKKHEGQIKSYEEKLNNKEQEMLAQKKELESKIEEAEKEANRYKTEALELKLQEANEKNRTYEQHLSDIKTSLEKQVTEMTEERNKQREEIFMLKTATEALELKLHEANIKNRNYEEHFIDIKTNLEDLKIRLRKETERNNDNENQFKEINTKMQNQNTDMADKMRNQSDEMSLFKRRFEKQITETTQERNKQREEISLLKTAMQKQNTDMTDKMRNQSDEISSLKSRMEKQVTDMAQENSKLLDEISSLKSTVQKPIEDMTEEGERQGDEITSSESTIKTHPVYQVKSYQFIDVRVKSDKEGCFIQDMCQMSDGTVVIIDSNNENLMRLDDDYNVKDFYDFNDRPVSVVPVSSSNVAVLMSSWQIKYINVDKDFVIEEVIHLEDMSEYFQNCMIYCNDKIWIYCPNGIHVYSLSGSLMKHIKEDSRGQIYKSIYSNYISTNKDNTKVFVLNDFFVDVLNTDGEVLSSFPIHDMCSCMTITTDDVLVLFNYVSRKVVMYDMEGNNLGDLITGNDFLLTPRSLLYDRNKNCLIVGSDRLQIHKLALV